MAQTIRTPQNIPAGLVAQADQLEAAQAARGAGVAQLMAEVEVSLSQQRTWDVRDFSFDEEQALVADEVALEADLAAWGGTA